MGIPILNELNEELKRLYVAGSSLSKGDPRVVKYIAPLKKLGEKAPVFNSLASKLTELTEGDDKKSPENLMEAGMLLYSLIYTQGRTDADEEVKELEYKDRPLSVNRIPYSSLYRLVELLTSGTQTHETEIEDLFKRNLYNDPRLYPYYCEAITENRSYISNYVAETIVPAIGKEMIPFIEEALNINGTKRDARLFKVLYSLKGKDIIPLSMKVFEEGSPLVLVEAIYSLGEDPKYEDLLLQYAKDKKKEIRQAAFAALGKMKSQKGNDIALAALEKATLGDIAEFLVETDDERIIKKVYEEINKALDDPNKKSSKLKVLLSAAASRNEDEGIDLITKIMSNKKFFSDYSYSLDLYDIVRILYDSKSDKKDRALYEISKNNSDLIHYKALVGVRILPPEDIYKELSGNFKQDYHLSNALYQAYDMYSYYYNRDKRIPDSEKKWDRRWGEFFADKKNANVAYSFVYDDDEKTWNKILELSLKEVSKKYKPPFYAEVLETALKIGHRDSEKYFVQFLKVGYPSEDLEMIKFNEKLMDAFKKAYEDESDEKTKESLDKIIKYNTN